MRYTACLKTLYTEILLSTNHLAYRFHQRLVNIIKRKSILRNASTLTKFPCLTCEYKPFAFTLLGLEK